MDLVEKVIETIRETERSEEKESFQWAANQISMLWAIAQGKRMEITVFKKKQPLVKFSPDKEIEIWTRHVSEEERGEGFSKGKWETLVFPEDFSEDVKIILSGAQGIVNRYGEEKLEERRKELETLELRAVELLLAMEEVKTAKSATIKNKKGSDYEFPVMEIHLK